MSMQNPRTSSSKIETQTKNLHISYTGMSSTYMDGQYQKSWLRIVLNGEQTLGLMKNLYTTMTKTVIKDTCLKSVWVILRNYRKHSDLSLLPKRMNIDNCEKLLCNLYGKKNYAICIRTLKQVLNHGLILKKSTG